MNFEEKLDRYIETAHLKGKSASLKPIVLKLVEALNDARDRFAGGTETNGVFWREIACGEITKALAEIERMIGEGK